MSVYYKLTNYELTEMTKRAQGGEETKREGKA